MAMTEAMMLSVKLKKLNPGVIIIHKGCHPNVIFFGQWPERLNWPKGFHYDKDTEKISGASIPITAKSL